MRALRALRRDAGQCRGPDRGASRRISRGRTCRTRCRRGPRGTPSIARFGTGRRSGTARRCMGPAGLPEPQPVVTAFTLSLDTPDNMRAAAAKNAHRPLLKIKLGTPDDMPRLEAVRAARRRPDDRRCQRGLDGRGLYRSRPASRAPRGQAGGTAAARRQDDMLAEIDRPLPVCADESCHDRASLPG
jgi:hypothetical protein